MFAPIARTLDHPGDAARWETHAQHLQRAIADNAWDGAWYVRAFDDDGVPWGSKDNDECQIDLIAQAWSVLSGSHPDERTYIALQSAQDHLVDADARLIRLLTPPFDQTERDPGYILAYPPGIRENGGQYTHAATWLGHAYVTLGDGDRAHEVFDLINPIRRSANRDDALHYKREPYVLTGDVSGAGDRTGQGGWSWYTGSAAWMYQLGVEGILGIKPEAGAIRITPCLPNRWARARATLDSDQGRIEVQIEQDDRLDSAQMEVIVDGRSKSDTLVTFPGRGQLRTVAIRLPRAPSPDEA